MKEKNISLLYRLFRIILSISIIGAGLCLIYGCLAIYFSGPQPYSAQAVAEAFSKISIPIYICLGLIALSIIIELLPFNFSVTHKAQADYKHRLRLLSQKKDFSTCNKLDEIKAEQKSRKLTAIIKWALITASGICFLIYSVNPANYHSSDINSSVIKAMLVLAPCLLVMLAASLVADLLTVKSIKKEIALISDLPAKKSAEMNVNFAEAKSERKMVFLRCAVLLIALGLLIYGFITGGVADVLTKAVNICTECIGLG